jgi:hypothetical protein
VDFCYLETSIAARFFSNSILFVLPANGWVTKIGLVIRGGNAELFAGSISMGLGAYLAAITDRKHYEVEEARQGRRVTEVPDL